MCGIFGIRSYGMPIEADQLKWLLCGLQGRGTDAAGLALMTAGEVHVYKEALPAWRVAASEGFEQFLKDHLTSRTTMALGHTRAATVGRPQANENNHPITAGKAVVVHNGSCSNHRELFDSLQLDRACETDSDILRAILDKHGMTEAGVKELKKVRGCVAAGVFDPREPERLLVLKSGNPLVFASLEGQLMFASTKEALHRATKTWTERFGLPMMASRSDARFLTMPTDTAWLFDAQGKVAHWHYETASYTSWSNGEKYWRKQGKRWN